MKSDLLIQLKRVEELINELEIIYKNCLSSKNISPEAKVVTHEIFEKLCNILDQITRAIWLKNLSITLSEEDKNKATIYFPVSNDQHQFVSTIGRWRIQDLEHNFPDIYNFFNSRQPFISDKNNWLLIVKELANKKHIGLIPQKREKITNITYTSPSGTVMFNARAVRFGSGAHILGAPVDPTTQRIVPTPGVREKIEVWVAFKIEGFDLNILPFCRESCLKVSNIVEIAIQTFNID